MAKDDDTAKNDAVDQPITGAVREADAKPDQRHPLRVKSNLRAGDSGWGSSGWGTSGWGASHP